MFELPPAQFFFLLIAEDTPTKATTTGMVSLVTMPCDPLTLTPILPLYRTVLLLLLALLVTTMLGAEVAVSERCTVALLLTELCHGP